MPIKLENKKLYPENWKDIRNDILKRANNKCEFCGVKNYSIGYRDEFGNFIETLNTDKKLIKIILTIAHLDHNPQHNDYNNLRALCQKCHNNYDKEHRKETRRKTKLKHKVG